MLEIIHSFITSTLGDAWSDRLDLFANGKHIAWYASVKYNLIAAFSGAVYAIFFGLIATAALRSTIKVFRSIGILYTSLIRGIPEVLIFLFFPLAFEQTIEFFAAHRVCSDIELKTYSQWPPCPESQWYVTSSEYLMLAGFSLGIIYGSYAANVINGAISSVPEGQTQAAMAFGFSRQQIFWRFTIRQMWVFALPGLSNVWLLLFKATSLLSLLQITDVVFWADRLGAANYFPSAGPVHPDWRWRYYLALLVFYIIVTYLSEQVFKAMHRLSSRGMRLNH